MRFRAVAVALAAEVAVAAALLAMAACAEQAVVVEVSADGLDAPGDLDALCLAVGDRDAGGGEFARRYLFGEGGLDGLPQTLTVDAGEASEAFAWARGYWRGIEVARDTAAFSFDDGEVGLSLAACPGGPGGPPRLVAEAALPPGSVVALSIGRTGSEIVAVGDGASALVRARGGELEAVAADLPEATGGALELIAFDADGDCDDDLLLVPVEGTARVWRREPDGSFAEIDAALGGGAAGARAAAAADVDADGDIDLALGGADGLVVWLNDGAGRFARHPAPIEDDDTVDVTRLGFGDLDGDGAIDLVVGRGAAEPATTAVLLNAGDGAFESASGAPPGLPYQVRTLAVRDMDGDGSADLVEAGEEMPVKLFIGRGDGRLEDQSFRLPEADLVDVGSLAAADWDGDCRADLVVGLASGGEPLSWRSDAAGNLVDDGSPAAVGQAVLLGDADDDGDIDLLTVSGGDQLGWAAR